MAVLGTSKKKVTTCFLFARFFVEKSFSPTIQKMKMKWEIFVASLFYLAANGIQRYILEEGPLQSNSVA